VVVEPPAAVVVEVPPAAVVVVAKLPPTVVVVVAELLPPPEAAGVAELGGGSFSFPEVPLAVEVPPPVSPLIHIPAMTATRTAAKSCQVFQVRRSLSLSAPGRG
jgi:hypothetical protein